MAETQRKQKLKHKEYKGNHKDNKEHFLSIYLEGVLLPSGETEET